MLKLPQEKQKCIAVCKALNSIKNQNSVVLEWLKSETERLHSLNVVEDSDIRIRRRQGEISIVRDFADYINNAKNKVMELEKNET